MLLILYKAKQYYYANELRAFIHHCQGCKEVELTVRDNLARQNNVLNKIYIFYFVYILQTLIMMNKMEGRGGELEEKPIKSKKFPEF